MEAKAQIKAGDTVTAYGHDWEILDPEYEGKDGPGILCLTKGIIRTMAFSDDGCNDYAKSGIKKFLEDEFTPRLEERGAKFKAVELDLTADDGTGWNKEPLVVRGAFLLTDALYRKYYRFISKKKDWWWTATAYSFSSSNSRFARLVYADGSLDYGSAFYGNCGLAPACIFSFLPEQRTKDTAEEVEELKDRGPYIVSSVIHKSPIEENEELKKRVAELEKRIREAEGGRKKETTLYICEICKERYADRKEAEKCEAAHIKPRKLTKKMKFHPYKSGKDPIFAYREVSQYPDWIDIEMQDGNTVRYKR